MLLCPSLMCADYGNLRATVEEPDAAGIDIFHCDVMDGSFVPNFAMGLEDIKAVRAATNKLVDVHLMVENPASKVELFAAAGADIIYIHPESERYVVKTLAAIKSLGKSAGIAVNPDTSISEVEEMLNLCDYVMVMTVNPGFAGQSFIEFTNDKVRRLAALKERFGFEPHDRRRLLARARARPVRYRRGRLHLGYQCAVWQGRRLRGVPAPSARRRGVLDAKRQIRTK